MALEIFKCACGQEFEDSEFRVSSDCDECRCATPPTPVNGASFIEVNWAQVYARLRAAQTLRTNTDTVNQYWNGIYTNSNYNIGRNDEQG